MRVFAALYAVAAAWMVSCQLHWHDDRLAWVAVGTSAAVLGMAFALKRPLVMLSAAHAGLTATWAGTEAARPTHHGCLGPSHNTEMLLILCAGMAVLIVAGLRATPAPATVKSSPP